MQEPRLNIWPVRHPPMVIRYLTTPLPVASYCPLVLETRAIIQCSQTAVIACAPSCTRAYSTPVVITGHPPASPPLSS